jgi:hypothetical protein
VTCSAKSVPHPTEYCSRHASAAPLAHWALWALLRMVAGGDGQATESLRTAPVKLATTNRAARHEAQRST